MQKSILLLAGTLLACMLNAQDDNSEQKRARIILELSPSFARVDGQLIQTEDSSLLIRKEMMRDEFFASSNYANVSIPVREINTIKFRQKGKVGSGVLIGALVGFGVGALIGLADGDDPPNPNAWFDLRFSAGEKAMIGGATLALPGALIGAIIGASARVVIPIGGKQDTYAARRAELVPYTILKK